jgi:hypothetical protein
MSASHLSMLALGVMLGLAGCASTPAPSDSRLKGPGPSNTYTQTQVRGTGYTTNAQALATLDPDLRIAH